MQQLSLYDFLSFFLPGFVAAELLRISVDISMPVKYHFVHFSDAEKAILLLAPGLLLGLFIHRLSTGLLFKNSWYQRLLKPEMNEIVKRQDDIKKICTSLNEYCQEALQQPLTKAAGDFFDYAYYFLEASNKIGPAKAYQSLYFFCTNVITLCYLTALLIPLIIYDQHWECILGIVSELSLLFVIILCIYAGRFCRTKMTIRVFWTFHIVKKEPTIK